MLQKLRTKFIVMTMMVMFLVLTVIMGTINYLNYLHVLNSADQTLELLLEGNGSFPERFFPNQKSVNQKISPELPYETRFFTITLAEDGSTISVDIGKIAAITSETAVSYAKEALDSKHAKGFIEEYRYAIQTAETTNMIVFMDCGRQLSSTKSFFLISIGISLVGFFSVSLLLYILSARIVRPISDSYEKQRQFITNASHDLKTPITIIDADLDILEMDYGENEWMQDIGKQTKRLTKLIQELVFLSRMEEKGNHFQMIDFPISDVLEETAQSFESLADTQKKEFHMKIQPSLSYCGDANAICRLVSILLDNALKYSDENGNITIFFEKVNHSLKLIVSNTCQPISKEDIKHLFDRFYRGDKSRNSQTGGYGIGLSIAKAIAEAHKGSVQATSKDGHSLTIIAQFPIK